MRFDFDWIIWEKPEMRCIKGIYEGLIIPVVSLSRDASDLRSRIAALCICPCFYR